MSTNSTGMDPMTMLMLMQAMNSGNNNSGGGQQYGTPPQNGGMGGVSQTTQASPLASGSNALAGAIRQRALSAALKKYMGGGAPANFDTTGLGVGGMPSSFGTATASQISDPVAAAGGYTDGLASYGAGGLGDRLAGAGAADALPALAALG